MRYQRITKNSDILNLLINEIIVFQAAMTLDDKDATSLAEISNLYILYFHSTFIRFRRGNWRDPNILLTHLSLSHVYLELEKIRECIKTTDPRNSSGCANISVNVIKNYAHAILSLILGVYTITDGSMFSSNLEIIVVLFSRVVMRIMSPIM